MSSAASAMESITLITVCKEKMELEALRLLDEEDINVNQMDEYGDTALIWACNNKMERVALRLLDRAEIDVNQIDKYGNSALILACYN